MNMESKADKADQYTAIKDTGEGKGKRADRCVELGFREHEEARQRDTGKGNRDEQKKRCLVEERDRRREGSRKQRHEKRKTPGARRKRYCSEFKTGETGDEGYREDKDHSRRKKHQEKNQRNEDSG